MVEIIAPEFEDGEADDVQDALDLAQRLTRMLARRPAASPAPRPQPEADSARLSAVR